MKIKRILIGLVGVASLGLITTGCDWQFVSRYNIGSNGYGGVVRGKAVGDGTTGIKSVQAVVLCRRPNGTYYYRSAPYYSGPGTGYGGIGDGLYESTAWCDQTTDRAVSISYNPA